MHLNLAKHPKGEELISLSLIAVAFYNLRVERKRRIFSRKMRRWFS